MDTKAVDMYREHNTQIFNPDKSFSKDDIDAAFSHESNLFNSIEDGISILDTDLNIVRVNFTMQKWYAHKQAIAWEKVLRGLPRPQRALRGLPHYQGDRDAQGPPRHRILLYEGKRAPPAGMSCRGFPSSTAEKLAGIVEYVKDITCEMDLYSKICAIEKNMGHIKSQNELLKTYIEQKEDEKQEIEDTIKGNVKQYIKPVL